MGYKKAIKVMKCYLKNYPDASTVEDGSFRGICFYLRFGIGNYFMSLRKAVNLLKRPSLQDKALALSCELLRKILFKKNNKIFLQREGGISVKNFEFFAV